MYVYATLKHPKKDLVFEPDSMMCVVPMTLVYVRMYIILPESTTACMA